MGDDGEVEEGNGGSDRGSDEGGTRRVEERDEEDGRRIKREMEGDQEGDQRGKRGKREVKRAYQGAEEEGGRDRKKGRCWDGEGKEGRKEGEEIKEKISEIEMKLGRKKREKKKNIVIRGLNVEEGRRKEAVEAVMRAIRVEIEAKGVWRIADERKKGRKMVGIRLEERGKEERFGKRKRS